MKNNHTTEGVKITENGLLLEDFWYLAHEWRESETPEDLTRNVKRLEEWVTGLASRTREEERGALAAKIEKLPQTIMGISAQNMVGEWESGYSSALRDVLNLLSPNQQGR